MQITQKIIIILSLLIATSVSAEQSCLSVVNSDNSGCSKLSGSYEIAKNQNDCGYLSNDSICCCEKPAGLKAVSTKYIIIASVVIVLGVATVLSFLIKKNEYEE